MNCPNPACKCKLIIEDHSSVGGDKEYWLCPKCGEEKVMFGLAKVDDSHDDPRIKEFENKLNLNYNEYENTKENTKGDI